MDTGFINRPMSIALDLVRAGAAFAVLAGHAAQMKIYTGSWPFSALLQHDAVVVFFVLSGLVIASSTERNRTNLLNYTVARCARILPLALFATVFSVTAFCIAASLAPHPPIPSEYDHLQARIVLPLFFSSETRSGLGALWNSPYWSLCYEAWYYALFAAAFFLRGRRRAVSLATLAFLAGFRVLLLFPIWMMGVWLARARVQRKLNSLMMFFCPVIGLLLVQLANFGAEPVKAKLLVISELSPADLRFSEHVLTDLLLGLGVTLCFIGLRLLADEWTGLLERCEPPIRYAAGMSFTLYMLHWPMLRLLKSFSISAGDSLLLFVVFLIGICALCAAIASLIERKQAYLRQAISRLLPAPGPPDALTA